MNVGQNRVSVIIPTKNAGPDFPDLLRKLRSQKGVDPVEIVIVDSGSSDATLKWARKFDCRTIRIKPSEFSHSYARNLGVRYASGENLLFMVQDALPTHDRWLCDLSNALEKGFKKKVVAVSCDEVPRADSDLFYNYLVHQRNRLLNGWNQDRVMGGGGADFLAQRKNSALNNVACLIRKTIFEKYRFRGFYAEDLDLARRLTEDGHKIGFLSSVKVIHSHIRPPFYFLKRAFLEPVSLAKSYRILQRPQPRNPVTLSALIFSLFEALGEILPRLQSLEVRIHPKGLCRFVSEEILHRIVQGKIGREKESSSWRQLPDKELVQFLHYLKKLNRKICVPCRQRGKAESLMLKVQSSLEPVEKYLAARFSAMDQRPGSELSLFFLKYFSHISGAVLGQLYLRCEAQGTYLSLRKELWRRLSRGV